jgi:hypothetical protein
LWIFNPIIMILLYSYTGPFAIVMATIFAAIVIVVILWSAYGFVATKVFKKKKR